MPFTFSHPAVILPLYKIRWLSLTGLIIGSITPDFEYFLRMEDKRVYTHTWEGMLIYDLPLGLFLAFIFHNIIKNELFPNFPTFISKRLLPFTSFKWNAYFKRNWLQVVFSFVIGASSHLFWDGFTHENGYFVEQIPLMKATYSFAGILVEGHMMAQVFSSIFGGIIILIAFFKIPLSDSNLPKHNGHTSRSYWITLFSFALLLYLVKIFLTERIEIEDYIIPVISALLYSLITVSAIFKLSKKTPIT